MATKYDHLDHGLASLGNARLSEAGHPFPDRASLVAGHKLLDLVASGHASDTLLLLVPGGASALAEVLRHGMTREGLRAFTDRALASG